MTISRFYRMTAAEGKAQALGDALRSLAARVRSMEGSEGVVLYRDREQTDCFVFIEAWRSADDQKAAGQALGKAAFAPIQAALAGPPETRDLDNLID